MLHLLVCLLFLGKANIVCNAPEKKVWFSPTLHRHAVLCMDYPPEDEASPVSVVVWKKCEHKPIRILRYTGNKSECSVRYCNRTQYYFKNNTLILDNILEEDKGIYEVSLIYQNDSVWTAKLHLFLIVPPPDPSIKVDMNNSSTTLELTCEVERGMDLSYHWLKRGQLLPQDERHSLVERNSTLQVNNFTNADCVNYTCVADNGLARSEGHIQLNGSAHKMCAGRAAPALTLKGILSIAVAAICAFGMLLLILCIRRREEIRRWLRGHNSNKQPATSRRGQGNMTDETNATGFHVYDEIGEEQVSPAPQQVAQLTCVYSDFIQNHPNQRSPRSPAIEDFGYSTINTVEPQSSHWT